MKSASIVTKCEAEEQIAILDHLAASAYHDQDFCQTIARMVIANSGKLPEDVVFLLTQPILLDEKVQAACTTADQPIAEATFQPRLHPHNPNQAANAFVNGIVAGLQSVAAAI